MKPELVHYLHAWIVKEGGAMTDYLPQHESHPGGRNGIAHIYHVVKSIMGRPLKECCTSRYEDIVDIIQFCIDNTQDKHINSQIRSKYHPEPTLDAPATLEDFL
jgi:hypothetical protein